MNHTNGTILVAHPAAVEVIRKVYAVVLIVIFIIGMVGNALTVVVLCTKRLRQSSTAIYLTALAIVDMLYLVVSLLVSIVNFTILFPKDLRHESSLTCYLSPFLHYTLAYLSVWLMVAVTVDRAIWVTKPFKAKHVCTQRNAVITIILITVALVIMDSHFFWTMRYGTVDSSHTTAECIPDYFTSSVFPYIDMLLICCFPFVFMLVSNIMIGWQLKRMREFSKRRQATHTQRVRIPSIVPSSQHDDLSTRSIASTVINSSRMRSSETKECERKRRRREPNDSMKVKSNTEKSSALTAMLIAISVFFMVSVSPLMIYDVLYYAVDLNKWIEGDEPWRVTIIVAVERFVYTLWYTNFAIHFILYCLNGPPFRAKAVSLFRSTCCRPLHQGHCALIEGGPSVIECEKMRLRITASTKTTRGTTAQKTTQQTSQEAWESKKWIVGKSQDQAKGQMRVVVPAIILEAEDPDISNERRVASTFI